jgi:hypothetical protein
MLLLVRSGARERDAQNGVRLYRNPQFSIIQNAEGERNNLVVEFKVDQDYTCIS